MGLNSGICRQKERAVTAVHASHCQIKEMRRKVLEEVKQIQVFT